MTVAFYMDVHVPRAVTVSRMRAIDVLTAQEDEGATLDDNTLLRRARSLGRILASQDEDLLRVGMQFLNEEELFLGTIYAHQLRVSIGQMIEDLLLIAKATTVEEWQGRIEYLPL